MQLNLLHCDTGDLHTDNDHAVFYHDHKVFYYEYKEDSTCARPRGECVEEYSYYQCDLPLKTCCPTAYKQYCQQWHNVDYAYKCYTDINGYIAWEDAGKTAPKTVTNEDDRNQLQSLKLIQFPEIFPVSFITPKIK